MTAVRVPGAAGPAPSPLGAGPALPGLPRLAVLCAVLGLHAALLWWVTQAPAPQRQRRPEAMVVDSSRMRWIVATPPMVPSAAAHPPSQPAMPATRPEATPATGSTARAENPPDRRAPVREQMPPGKAALATPPDNPSVERDAAAPTMPTEPAATAAPPGPAPLDLRLPPAMPWNGMSSSAAADGGARGQALNDPRGNSHGARRLEERIQDATTRNDSFEVEERGLGRRRVRGGGRCVDVQQARNAQIDPMNEVSTRTMAMVEACR